jgi:Domain of unknown function (DUF4360)
MNFAKVFLATATLMVASISPSFANDKVEIVGVSYRGSGCPQGSASVDINPDGQKLSILFGEFKTFGNREPEERRKDCNLTIPVKVPAGLQISIYTANYRGSVDENTTGKLRVEYFFAGESGIIFEDLLKGEIDYDVPHELNAAVWSACGESVNMRVNASMRAKGDGMATVDTFDLKRENSSRGLVYKIKYRSCNK